MQRLDSKEEKGQQGEKSHRLVHRKNTTKICVRVCSIKK